MLFLEATRLNRQQDKLWIVPCPFCLAKEPWAHVELYPGGGGGEAGGPARPGFPAGKIQALSVPTSFWSIVQGKEGKGPSVLSPESRDAHTLRQGAPVPPPKPRHRLGALQLLLLRQGGVRREFLVGVGVCVCVLQGWGWVGTASFVSGGWQI